MPHPIKAALRAAVLFILAIALAGPFHGQNAPANPDEGFIKHLKWRNIGPANMVGRISDFEALDKDFTFVLVAGAAGGVFKSINAGTTWEPIFDTYGSASIGDVAIFQKNPSILWVGTGEECVRNSISWGDGIYKSVDGGKTFNRMGLETTQTIARVLTHPTDANVVYVAASGHPWGYTGDRGLFKTTDGGKTWMKLGGGLPDDGKTGAIDLIMHPTDPNTLFVALWQRLRQPWRFDSGGPNGGIFKTTNGGRTWTKLVRGLPAGDVGRIGLAISRSNPRVLAAVVEHGFQPQPTIVQDGQQKPNPEYADMTKLGTGIYRSEDGGATWKYMNRMNNRPFYYSHIYINPVVDTWIYFLTSSFNFSSDGGKTWSQIGGLHPDFHALWLDPTNKNRMYVGQDGGASISHDHGKSWIYFDNLSFAQFYAVSADMRDPYWVYGGLQDNGTWGGPSMSREGAILTDFWFNFMGGDGFHTQNDPTDWRTVYGESQGGNASRTNVETRESRSIRPNLNNTVNYKEFYPDQPAAKGTPQTADQPGQKPAGQAAGQRGGIDPQQAAQFGGPRGASVFRFNWSTPIVLSPHNPRTVYVAGQHLFRSLDRGDHWMIISPDLTTNDKSKFGIRSGGTDTPTGGMTPDVTGAETHCTIITVSESPVTPGLIWAGTDDGNVQVTRNGGVTWTNVRPNIAGVPEKIWCSRVEASHFDEGTCYATFDGHRSDDFHPYAFKTTDYGKTWTTITAGIPDGQPVYVIREDLKNKALLFLGTEFGAFVSRNAGQSWTSLSLNLPTVAVHDLLIHSRDNDLIAATHGRGFWIMDDISGLRQATDAVAAQEAALFEPGKAGTRWLRLARGGYGRGDLFYRGENPPAGALLHYYLKAKPEKTATLEISDITGQFKTTYLIDAAEAGIGRIVWDFAFDPPAATVQNNANNLKKQIEAALLRTDLTAEQKTALQEAMKKLDLYGTNNRKVQEIQGIVFPIIGRGMFGQMGARGGGQFGRMGGQMADPGTYSVKLEVNGKTYAGKVAVRLDPIQTDGN
jgi:photosystem II stability/assembly factor-like uncharacterized protein